MAEAELLRVSNRMRFILAVTNGSLRVSNRSKVQVEQDLTAQGFDRLPANQRKVSSDVATGLQPGLQMASALS